MRMFTTNGGRKKGAGRTKQREKIIFSFIRNSSKICNRNRDQKYVKFKRAAAKLWLIKKTQKKESKEKAKQKQEKRKSFSSKAVFLQVFSFQQLSKLLCFWVPRFVLCKTVLLNIRERRAGLESNTAIAGMFEINSSVQHEEQKKLTFFPKIFSLLVFGHHIYFLAREAPPSGILGKLR